MRILRSHLVQAQTAPTQGLHKMSDHRPSSILPIDKETASDVIGNSFLDQKNPGWQQIDTDATTGAPLTYKELPPYDSNEIKHVRAPANCAGGYSRKYKTELTGIGKRPLEHPQPTDQGIMNRLALWLLHCLQHPRLTQEQLLNPDNLTPYRTKPVQTQASSSSTVTSATTATEPLPDQPHPPTKTTDEIYAENDIPPPSQWTVSPQSDWHLTATPPNYYQRANTRYHATNPYNIHSFVAQPYLLTSTATKRGDFKYQLGNLVWTCQTTDAAARWGTYAETTTLINPPTDINQPLPPTTGYFVTLILHVSHEIYATQYQTTCISDKALIVGYELLFTDHQHMQRHTFTPILTADSLLYPPQNAPDSKRRALHHENLTQTTRPKTTREYPGDWDCPQCGNFNFAKNVVCGGTLYRPTPGDDHYDTTHCLMASPHAHFHLSWLCPTCSQQNEVGNYTCTHCNKSPHTSIEEYRRATHRQTQQRHNEIALDDDDTMDQADQADDEPPPNLTTGDWTCRDNRCGNHNYSSRRICNRCSLPRSQPPLNTLPPVPVPRPQDHENYRPAPESLVLHYRGDAYDNSFATDQMDQWICPNTTCYNANFRHRLVCARCNTKKPLHIVHDHDWYCMHCKQLHNQAYRARNYAHQFTCHWCMAPRQTHTIIHLFDELWQLRHESPSHLRLSALSVLQQFICHKDPYATPQQEPQLQQQAEYRRITLHPIALALMNPRFTPITSLRTFYIMLAQAEVLASHAPQPQLTPLLALAPQQITAYPPPQGDPTDYEHTLGQPRTPFLPPQLLHAHRVGHTQPAPPPKAAPPAAATSTSETVQAPPEAPPTSQLTQPPTLEAPPVNDYNGSQVQTNPTQDTAMTPTHQTDESTSCEYQNRHVQPQPTPADTPTIPTNTPTQDDAEHSTAAGISGGDTPRQEDADMEP